MKILLVADKIHKALYDYFEPERWQDIDLIISAGDLSSGYLQFLVTMIKGAPLFYVRGNHDDKYEKDPPLGCVNIHGRIVEYNGLRILGLEGSRWYNGKGIQYKENRMWWEFLKLWPRLKYGRKIDIVLTHNPPYGLNDGKGHAHRGFKSFRYLIDTFEPRFFIHGHQHLSYAMRERIVQYKNTKIINAYEYYVLEI
ncbi:MAG: metallophosphoesterase [Halanaerobiaceae bacterium]|nr:metallophosphoesterase [Halanaerobiaceae bacterium]